MSEVLAYFLTWTTYGTWLHGDPRGSVDTTHNRLGTPVLEPDSARFQRSTHALRDPPFVMGDLEREVVRITIEDHAQIRSWKLHALNVRTNHVHVVVRCRDACTPTLAMRQFKSWSTRRLVEAGCARQNQYLWTDHGSTRWIKHREGLSAAIEYVKNQQ